MASETTAPDERPRLTKKGQATRDRIVRSAAELIFEQGVANTTIEDVQARASVAPSQLYHYFKGKQSLVRAVIVYQTEATLNAQRPLLDRLDSMEALRAWRERIIEIHESADCQGGCALGSLASELNKSDGDGRVQLAESFGQWESAIRTGLHAMRDRGALRADADPDKLATALLSTVEGGVLLTETRRSSTSVATALEVMLDHIQSLTTTPS